MTIKYDTGASYIYTLCCLQHSVVPSVVQRWEFWLFISLNLFFTIMFRSGFLPGADAGSSGEEDDERRLRAQTDTALKLSWHHIKIVSSLTTFLMVNYANQVFSRYWLLYRKTMNLYRDLLEYCFEVSLILDEENRKYLRAGMRYFSCSVFLFFHELRAEAYRRGGFDQDNVHPPWSVCEAMHFILNWEATMAGTMVPKKELSLYLLHNCAEVTRAGFFQMKGIPQQSLKTMIDKLVTSRESQQEIVDIMKLPMPFQYYHVLNTMVVINLTLWSYGFAVCYSVFAPMCYFMATLIFMGILEMCMLLSDPFGEDITDFPLGKWLSETLTRCQILVEDTCPFDADGFASLVALEEPLELAPDMLTRYDDSARDPEVVPLMERMSKSVVPFNIDECCTRDNSSAGGFANVDMGESRVSCVVSDKELEFDYHIAGHAGQHHVALDAGHNF